VSVVCVGDSLTFAAIGYAYQWAGVAAASLYDTGDVPRTGLRKHVAPGVIFANWAMSGWRIAELEAQAASLDALICDSCPVGAGRPARKYVLVVRIGTNVQNSDPAVSAARLRAYCQARQAAGWHVIVCPIPSRTDGIIASFDLLYAQPLNAILATWTVSDGVAGVVSNADAEMYGTLASTTQTSFWNADKVHPLEAGHTRLKSDLDAVLNPLIAQLQA
jgi:hypothetical protein